MKTSTNTIAVTSSAFENDQPIPKKFTGDGQDVSPPLAWKDAPAGTKQWALICDDPDAPGRIWVHWVLFNLPGNLRSLKEGVPAQETFEDASRQGQNDFGNLGYGGPAPPRGKPHRYEFKLYALDAMLTLPARAKKDDVIKAMTGHILEEGQLMGKYQR